MTAEHILTMPRLGETMESGRLASWLVQPGVPFERGDPLFEVETDKVVAEVPALGAGTLRQVLSEPGQDIAVGAPLAVIDARPDTGWDLAPDGETGIGKAGGDVGAAPEARSEIELVMPRLGETMETGRIGAWLVELGAKFHRGDPLVEIETDKTVAELPAAEEGELTAILALEGVEAAVGAPIARFRTVKHGAQATNPASTIAPEPALPWRPAEATERPVTSAKPLPRAAGVRVRATPAARQRARLAGIDLSMLRGTGRRGRIEVADVASNASAADSAVSANYCVLASGRLAYSTHGTPGQRTVLLLHGFAADRTVWAGLANKLGRTGLFVLSPDLPGHGETTIEASSTDALGMGLPDLLDQLRVEVGGLEVIGHSAGAIAAVKLAEALTGRRRPLRRLTLIAPVGLGLEIDIAFLKAMAAGPTAGTLSHLLRRLTVNGIRLGSAALEQASRELGAGRLQTLADALAGDTGQRIDLVGALERLSSTVETRAVVGLQDRIIPWTQVAALPPQIAVHVFSRSGHMPQWDQPDELAQLVKGTVYAEGSYGPTLTGAT